MKTDFTKNVPHSIDEGVNTLIGCLEESELRAIKNGELSAIDLHHGLGTDIRNAWGLWEKEQNSLCKELAKEEGGYCPDGQSNVLLEKMIEKIKTESKP